MIAEVVLYTHTCTFMSHAHVCAHAYTENGRLDLSCYVNHLSDFSLLLTHEPSLKDSCWVPQACQWLTSTASCLFYLSHCLSPLSYCPVRTSIPPQTSPHLCAQQSRGPSSQFSLPLPYSVGLRHPCLHTSQPSFKTLLPHISDFKHNTWISIHLNSASIYRGVSIQSVRVVGPWRARL